MDNVAIRLCGYVVNVAKDLLLVKLTKVVPL